MNKVPYLSNRVKFINNLTDLPIPVGNVITLEANTSYIFCGSINLGSNRLVSPGSVFIGGFSPATSSITSALGVGEALITAVGTVQVTDISLSVTGSGSIIFNLTGSGISRCILRELSVSGSGLGSITGYTAVFGFALVFSDIKSTLTVDGVCGVVIFDTCQFVNLTPGISSLTFPASFEATIRCRILASGFTSVAGATSINASTLMTINSSSFVIDSGIFAGGSLTHVVGMSASEDKAFFRSNNGIPNSFAGAHMYMHNNATVTVIGSIANWYKIAGAPIVVSANTQRFDFPTVNRLRYTSLETRKFRVLCIATVQDGNDQKLGLSLHKNGTILADTEMSSNTSGAGDPTNISTGTIIELAQNDYIEAFTRNYTSTGSVTALDLILVVTEI